MYPLHVRYLKKCFIFEIDRTTYGHEMSDQLLQKPPVTVLLHLLANSSVLFILCVLTILCKVSVLFKTDVFWVDGVNINLAES